MTEEHHSQVMKPGKLAIFSIITLLLQIAAYTVVAVYNTWVPPLEDKIAEGLRGEMITDIHMFLWSGSCLFLFYGLWKYFREKNQALLAAIFNLWFWLQVADFGDELFGQNTGIVSVWEYVFAAIAIISAILEWHHVKMWPTIMFICKGIIQWIKRKLRL